jgi:hypothetical protein
VFLSLCLTLALAAPPKAAVIVVRGAEALRVPLEEALAADPTVLAQPRGLVDELLAGAAAAGLVCSLNDAPCWTKVGLDGELDLLVIAGVSPSGAVELRLVDVGRALVARRVTLDGPIAGLDARAAVATILHEEGAPPAVEPSTSAPVAHEPQAPTPSPTPASELPRPASASVPLLLVAGGAGVVAVGCGVAAAIVDVGLSRMLVDAQAGVPLDREAYDGQETAQNVLVAFSVVGGAVAVGSAVGAWFFE